LSKRITESQTILDLFSYSTVQPPRATRSSSVVTLSRQPRPTSSSLRIINRSFRYASPHLWNQLPVSFRQPCIKHPADDVTLSNSSSGDATVLKRVFCDNFVIIRRKSNRIAFLESVNFLRVTDYMQIFNLYDGHVTAFRHPSGRISVKMPGRRLSRLQCTPSESRLSIGTVSLGYKYYL